MNSYEQVAALEPLSSSPVPNEFQTEAAPPKHGVFRSIISWFVPLDSTVKPAKVDRVDWVRSFPFLVMHLACLGVIWVGWSWIAVATAAALYVVHMFAMTAFYHRYFSHRAFKTSRFMQFLFGLIGCSAVQRGPLWWSAHHRHHHVHSDDTQDWHSPRQRGFLMSHMLWFLTPRCHATNLRYVPDLARYPELRFLDRFDMLVPVLYGVLCYLSGWALEASLPGLGTSGWQMLVWAFFISTVVTYHGVYLVNSLAHVIGKRRYPTTDDSRNSFVIAVVTMGEGWHNNHHHYSASARQGFYWWEIDATYYILVMMSWFGLVWDLKPVPERVLAEGRGE